MSEGPPLPYRAPETFAVPYGRGLLYRALSWLREQNVALSVERSATPVAFSQPGYHFASPTRYCDITHMSHRLPKCKKSRFWPTQAPANRPLNATYLVFS